MNENLVSIIIPTYNGDKYIIESIESSLNQSYKNIEIIVIDDGSNKVNIKEKLKEYIDTKKIIYFYQDNKGLSGARNTGLKIAKGNFIQFLDDDDLLESDKIEKQVKVLAEYKTCFGVYCKTKYFNSDTGEIIKILDEVVRENVYERLLQQNFFTVHSILFRKTNEFFDESLKSLEDYDLWLRIFKDKNQLLRYVEDTCCYVRVHGNNMSGNFERMLSNEGKVLEKHLEKNRYFPLISYRLFKIYYLLNDKAYKNHFYNCIKCKKKYIYQTGYFWVKQQIKKITKYRRNIYKER